MRGTHDDERRQRRNRDEGRERSLQKREDRRHARIKADDLLKNYAMERRLAKKNYVTQYDKCVALVRSVSEYCHVQYTTYNVPTIVPEEPYYDMDECVLYLKTELLKADFYVRQMQPGNILYISWRPEDIAKVKKVNRKQQELDEDEGQDRRRSIDRKKKNEKSTIEYDPDSALSNVRLTTRLMMDNPKYSHLDSVKKLKKRYGID